MQVFSAQELEQIWVDRVDDYWYGLLPVIGEYAGFSHNRCECCGGLAGDRYHVSYTSINDEDDLNGVCEVCSDCAGYIANGDVPTNLA